MTCLACACGSGGNNQENSLVTRSETGTALINVNLVVATGSHGVTLEEGLSIFEGAKLTLEEDLNLNLQLNRIEEIINPYSETNDQEQLFKAWSGWGRENNLLSNDSLLVVIIPPYDFGDYWSFGGMASEICSVDSNDSILISTAGPWSSQIPAQERFTKSAKTLAHEMAHLLGASHSENESLMSPSLNFHIQADLGLDSHAINQINSCLGLKA